jgi:hypothetical protein
MQLYSAAAAFVLLAGSAIAAEPVTQPLEQRFQQSVRPFLKVHCLSCHGTEKPKGKLDLSVFTSIDAVVKN